MKKIHYFLGVINSICIILVCLFIAVWLPAFTPVFYSLQYERNNTYSKINISEQDLMDVTKHMLRYMRGEEKSLQITATVDGVYREFFSQRELEHMSDVRKLFDTGFIILIISVSLIVCTVLLLALLRATPFYVIARTNQIVLSCFLAALIIFTGFVSLNFEQAFVIFHEIFFSNDYWILNPQIDLLINIVPLQFFISISIVISVIFVTLIFLTLISSIFIAKKYNNKNMPLEVFLKKQHRR